MISRIRLTSALFPLLLVLLALGAGAGDAVEARPAGAALGLSSESAAAGIAGTAHDAALATADRTLPQRYLGCERVQLDIAGYEAASTGSAHGESIRGRANARPRPPGAPTSQARAVRLARLAFARSLDAALSGERSLHGTSLPPPRALRPCTTGFRPVAA